MQFLFTLSAKVLRTLVKLGYAKESKKEQRHLLKIRQTKYKVHIWLKYSIWKTQVSI